MDNPSGKTSTSLIARVRLHDRASWERFCRIYGPMIYDWAKSTGLQSNDCADIMQEVLESQESGTEVAFQNPETGLAFRIKPQRTWKSASGHWCREFIEVVGDRTDADAPVSTACRVSKQRWVRVVTTLPGWQEPVLPNAATARDL